MLFKPMAGDQAAAFTFSGVDLRIGWLNNYRGEKHPATLTIFFYYCGSNY